MIRKIKVLFLASYPVEEPVTRFRIIQYFNIYRKHGVDPKFSSFLSTRAYKIKNKTGILITIEKIIWVFLACVKRFIELLLIKKYDIIYISKEAFPFGPPFIEAIIKKLNPNFIFDFDDAIFAYPKNQSKFDWRDIWKDKNRVSKIIKMSSLVIVGNQYLANYALKYNHNVHIIFTPIDTQRYTPIMPKDNKNVVIGWIGTWSNIQYLFYLKDVFESLAVKYSFILNIVGSKNIYDVKFNGVKIIYNLWSLNKEVKYLQNFDIGIMPLKNTKWERGKCGFKIVQYMAVGIPCVASPIGVNKNIVRDNINGFLAFSEEQWFEKLSLLIKDYRLRQRMGANARKLAENYYSTVVIAPKLVKLLKSFRKKNREVDK